jgi:hypothetical protein
MLDLTHSTSASTYIVASYLKTGMQNRVKDIPC